MYNHHGLKGAARIVYEDMARLLALGEPTTVTNLAAESGYSPRTISSAINELIERGLIYQDHENGRGAEYALCSGSIWNLEELMKALVQALARATRMSQDERSERLAMAFAADRIFSKGQRLKRLSRTVGGDFSTEAMSFVKENQVLKLTQVWNLEEANEIEQRLDELIERARDLK